MAELADAQDLGSCIVRCKGSSPFNRTNIITPSMRMYRGISLYRQY